MNKHQAFTLIELLIATTIFMMIMGIVTSLYHNLTKNTDKILGSIDLYQKANSVNRLLRDDFSQSLASSAMNIYTEGSPSFTSGDQEHLTFMRSLTRKYVASLNDLDNSSPNYATYDLSWVRWQWDNQGKLWRAQTRKLHNDSHNNGRCNPVNSNNPAAAGFYSYPEQWGTWAKPVQYFKHFVASTASEHQLCDLSVVNTYTNGTPRWDYPLRPEINIIHGNNTHAEYPVAGQRMTRGIWALHNGTTAMSGTGSYQGNLIPDAYCGVNADGLSFNKNEINLVGLPVGHSHYNDYPSQLHLLGDGFEYPSIELLKQDGSVFASSDNSAVGSNTGAVPGICLDGLDMQGRSNSVSPQHVRFTALIHMGNYIDPDYDDFDADGDSDEYAIDAIHQHLANVGASDHADLDRDGNRSETWITAVRDRSGSSESGAPTKKELRLAISYYLERERISYIFYQSTVKLAY